MQAVVQETYQIDMSTSIVARKYGISPGQVFNGRRVREAEKFDEGIEDEGPVSAAERKGYQERICRLGRLIGQKTEDIEILREAIRIGCEKNDIESTPAKQGRLKNVVLARALEVSRSNICTRLEESRNKGSSSAQPKAMSYLDEIKPILARPPTYGYCWITAILCN